MKMEMKSMLMGFAAAAVIGVCALRASVAQTGAPTLPGDPQPDAVLDALVQQVDPPQNQAPRYGVATNELPAGMPPAAAQSLDELRRLVDDATRTIQQASGEQQSKQAASRLAALVERLRQLDARPLDDLFGPATGATDNLPLVDAQRMEEISRLLNDLQAAQSPEARAATTQKIQQVLQRIRVLLAKRIEIARAPQDLYQADLEAARKTSATQRTGGGGRGGRSPFLAFGQAGAQNNPVSETFVQAAELRQIAVQHENRIRQASDSLRNAANDDSKAAAKKQLFDLLNEYFDKDLLRREEDLQQIEARVKTLREQLAKRRQKKDEIIELQIRVAENEADGLGFFSRPAEGQGSPWEASSATRPYRWTIVAPTYPTFTQPAVPPQPVPTLTPPPAAQPGSNTLSPARKET